MKIATKKAFTLTELLVIIGIVGILASVVLVSMSSSKQKARDKSVFATMQSVQPIIYKCFKSRMTTTAGTLSGRLSRPNETGPTSTSLCLYSLDGMAYIIVPGFPDWPVLPAGSGWSFTDAKFKWCPPTSNLTTKPTLLFTAYTEDSAGGDRDTGKFCFYMENDTNVNKYFWCTQDGCAKSGF